MPLDQVVAAEQQATWAGALWLRTPIRKQLGAQMLLGGPRTPQHVHYGLTMWILGGGRHVPQMVRLAEPFFDAETADALVRPLMTAIRVPEARDALAETAAATWDLLSDSTLSDLLASVPLDASVFGDASQTLWAQAVLRIPHFWQEGLQGLDPEQLATLVGRLAPRSLAELPPEAATRLLGAYESVDGDRDLNGEAGAIVLRWRLGRDVTGDVDPGVAVEVALRQPEALPASTYEATERQLVGALRREVEEAREGSAGFGPRPTATSLAYVAAARGKVDRVSVQALLDTAVDASVAANIRVDVLAGLARLAVDGLLSRRDLAHIRKAPEEGAPSFFQKIPRELLRASKLLARATALSDDEQVELLVLSRERDTRVRQLIANAAGLALARAPSTSAEAAILAGLFDPDERVVASSLRGAATASFSTRAVPRVVARRLRSLLEDYGRDVRAEAVRTARALRMQGHVDQELTEVLAAGVADRSWIVRDAADGGIAN
jgi:hypothetical protein